MRRIMAPPICRALCRFVPGICRAKIMKKEEEDAQASGQDEGRSHLSRFLFYRLILIHLVLPVELQHILFGTWTHPWNDSELYECEFP